MFVTALATLLWFHENSLHDMGLRFVKVARTLGSVLLAPPDESKVVIIALLAVSTAVFVRLNRDQKNLAREEQGLTNLRASLRQTVGHVSYGSLRDALRDQPTDSVLVRAVSAVWQARNLQTPDLEAISASVFVLEARRVGIGRSVANRLLLLSLLGTIIGLAGVIGTLHSQIGSALDGDTNTLLINLQGTLTTMGTAFASTAYGILLSLFIAAHASQVNERRSHHVAEVQYFAVCELAPRLLPVSLPQAISQIEALVAQSESFVTESRQLLDETRINNALYLQDMEQKTHKSAQLTANVVAGIEKTIRDAAQEIHDALTDAGRYVVDGAKAQIDVAKRLDTLLGQSTISMENAALDLKTGLQDLSGASNVVQSAYAGLNSAVTDLKASLNGQAKAIGEAARTSLENAAAAATVQQAATEKHSKEMQATLQGLSNQLTDFLRRAEPKLPSEQEWGRLQKTLDRCAEAATAFATAANRLEKDGVSSGLKASGQAGISPAEMQQILSAVTKQITDSVSSAPEPLRNDLRVIGQDLRLAVQSMERLTQQSALRLTEPAAIRPGLGVVPRAEPQTTRPELAATRPAPIPTTPRPSVHTPVSGQAVPPIPNSSLPGQVSQRMGSQTAPPVTTSTSAGGKVSSQQAAKQSPRWMFWKKD